MAMKKLRMVALGTVLVIGLAGCSSIWAVDYDEPLGAATTRNWRVVDVRVNVADSLSVSDQNTYAPNADIVWHGDPPGDRRAQVDAIVTAGIKSGTTRARGAVPVRLLVDMRQFHSVTPRAVRSAPSAVHDIRYVIQAVDARTGKPLTQPVETRADLEALTRDDAVAALLVGNTQKKRIIAHLGQVTAGWLSLGPDAQRTFRSIGR